MTFNMMILLSLLFLQVSVNGRTILITGDLKISNPVLEMKIENQDYTFQLIKHDGAGNLRIRFCGTTVSTTSIHFLPL